MRTIRFLLQKEFRQIFRNKSILAMILVMPAMQLIILPLAANFEVKNINLAVVDQDHSETSRQLVNKIISGGYFRLTAAEPSFDKAMPYIESDKADLILEIPAGFGKDLVRTNKVKVFVAVNAINGMKAGLGGSYLGTILANYNKDILMQWANPEALQAPAGITSTYTNRFNPTMNYRYYMVPGILAILITMVGGFLTALNIVKEKEVGTIEQINVTPIKKYHFILGKLIPFMVLGNVVFTVGMLVSFIVYGMVPAGNLLVMYGFIQLYLPAVLGLGLLVSTITETQQQSMFIMFFFMVIFILMGGLFTPIESMPDWAQQVAAFNPVSYLIKVLRMVMLKGSGWADVAPHAIKVLGFGLLFNTLAILNYRKTN